MKNWRLYILIGVYFVPIALWILLISSLILCFIYDLNGYCRPMVPFAS